MNTDIELKPNQRFEQVSGRGATYTLVLEDCACPVCGTDSSDKAALVGVAGFEDYWVTAICDSCVEVRSKQEALDLRRELKKGCRDALRSR